MKHTLIPQLITELRLEIWRLALPTPVTKALYPYQKGCWVFEDLGLEPDPNGEDLYLKFDTSLLDPLPIQLPLHAVNREARDVAVKYIQKHGLATPRDRAPSDFEFLRSFDPQNDTVFLPPSSVEGFVVDLLDRRTAPDMTDRYFGTSNPLLPRLAITPSAFELLKGERLETIFENGGTIEALYVVVDVAGNSSLTIDELEGSNARSRFELEESPCARLKWSSSRHEWDVSGEKKALVQMEERVRSLDDPGFTTCEQDFEVQLVHVTTAAAV